MSQLVCTFHCGQKGEIRFIFRWNLMQKCSVDIRLIFCTRKFGIFEFRSTTIYRTGNEADISLRHWLNAMKRNEQKKNTLYIKRIKAHTFNFGFAFMCYISLWNDLFKLHTPPINIWWSHYLLHMTFKTHKNTSNTLSSSSSSHSSLCRQSIFLLHQTNELISQKYAAQLNPNQNWYGFLLYIEHLLLIDQDWLR